MARTIIPTPGEGLQFILVEDTSGGSLVQIKPSVSTYNNLPIAGNTENDLRITRDTDRMYTWSISSSSGTLNDWLDIGQSLSLDWSAITGGPSSTPAQIDDAVTAMHSHANKALLDTYNQTNSNIEDAVNKKHTQNSDAVLDSGGPNEISAAEAKEAFNKIGYVGTKDVNEAQIGDDKVPTYDIASGKIIYKNRVSVQGGITYFLHEELSDIATYQKLLGSPADDPENTDTAIVNNGTGEVLIKSFVTDPGIPGTTLLSGGAWDIPTYASVDGALGVSTIVIRFYKRTTGGIETELFNVTTDEINLSSATLFEIESVQPDFIVDATDRLVVKYFAQTTSVVDRTVTLYYEGTVNYSHIHTPFISSDSNSHQQNTDTGTTSPTFALDTEASGFDPVKIKNESGILAARNNADDEYIDVKVKDIIVEGGLSDGVNSVSPSQIVTSEASGDWKKVTQILYNPVSEEIKVLYEE